MSEREKFHITADYYAFATGELEKEAQTYVMWMQSYPRDAIPIRIWATNSKTWVNTTKPSLKLREALRLDPDNLYELRQPCHGPYRAQPPRRSQVVS